MKHHLSIACAFALAIVALHAQLIDAAKPEPPAAQLAAGSIIDSINGEITHRVAVHRVCFETLWKNTREGATPAAILQKLGSKAALVFAFSRENLDHIDRCARLIGKTRSDFLRDDECKPPQEIVVHADGTASLKP